jgi:uncharacterized protein DUF4189
MTTNRLALFAAGLGAAATLAGLSLTTAVPAHAADTYASIYYSPATGAYGWAHQSGARQDAEGMANGYCHQYGGTDCQMAAWTVNGCVALATGPNNGAWYGWYGSSIADAQQAALAKNNGGTIMFSTCSWG